jgi:hypothetical protein
MESRKTGRTLKRLIGEGWTARASVSVRFADRAGNSATAKRIVVLREG